MLAGVITRLLSTERLGYVRPMAGGVPILFNALAVEGVRFADLRPGEAVTYTLERDPLGRGARATHVRPAAKPAPTPPATR